MTKNKRKKFNSKINKKNKDNNFIFNNKNKIISAVIVVIGLCLIAYSATRLITQKIDYAKSENLYEDVQDDYVSINNPYSEDDESNGITEQNWYEICNVNFDALKQKNSDVVGWIFFENEEISYPVLHGDSNDDYIHTMLDGSYATAGSIFLEANNTTTFEDSHTIIYGHNMRNLSMFGRLKYYRQDAEYYDSHKYFQIITPYASYRYLIFAYEEVADNSLIYSAPCAANDEFVALIDIMRNTSMISNNIDVGKYDRIVTLSTCTASDDRRFVVHGVLVDVNSHDSQ